MNIDHRPNKALAEAIVQELSKSNTRAITTGHLVSIGTGMGHPPPVTMKTIQRLQVIGVVAMGDIRGVTQLDPHVTSLDLSRF